MNDRVSWKCLAYLIVPIGGEMGEEGRNSGIRTIHVATAKCTPLTGTWSVDSATSYSFVIIHVHHIERATTDRLAS